MTTTATVSVEEYLNNAEYKLSEYLDGVVRDKYPMVGGVPFVSNVHGVVVSLIIEWFAEHKKEWRVKCGTEVTTLVGPTRYRLPDVSVIPFGPMDEYQLTPPLIAIEVLSPGSSGKDLLKKLEGYEQFGIKNVWVIDPQTRSGHACRGTAMTPTMRFEVPGTAIYLDLAQLLVQFDEENETRAE